MALANGPLTGGCRGKYGLQQVSHVRMARGPWHLGLCRVGKDRAQQDLLLLALGCPQRTALLLTASLTRGLQPLSHLHITDSARRGRWLE